MLWISHRQRTLENLIFGGASIGCLYEELDEGAAQTTLQTALDLGISHFDTAPLYGAGLSESRFGQFLPHDYNGRQVWISTKCGYLIKSNDDIQPGDRVDYEKAKAFSNEKFHQNLPVAIYTCEGVLESLRQSKERLQRKYIDCFRVHDTEDEDRFREATAPGAAIDTLIDLKQKGQVGEISLDAITIPLEMGHEQNMVVRFQTYIQDIEKYRNKWNESTYAAGDDEHMLFGSMNSPEYLLRYVRKYPKGTFDNIMMAGSWNLIDQSGYQLLLECQEKGIKVTNVGIFASGFLVGLPYYKYDSNVPIHVRQKLEQWTHLCASHNVSILNVAVSFALLPCVIENVAIGMREACEVEENVKLFKDSSSADIPSELWKEAQAEGLIPKDLIF